ncbi:MAG: 16S rRNA (cytosine(1402)-N(4))-methyltransferase RsmH [Lachnospiraceae bacterium]|nr:16S rRNA (cytosine(1402)-N(4))-methyltransferase RsmH [Lachnospiraceae bacterium]
MEDNTGFSHRSVLLEETIELLAIRPEGTYVDCTLGGGGHALSILSRLNEKGCLIGIDRDGDALKAAEERLTSEHHACKNVFLVRDNYRNIRNVLRELERASVDGVVLDLGVSSYQLDTPKRGFSYKEGSCAPLDMRMDQRQSLSAREVVNEYPKEELYRILRDYGEERFAAQIANKIAAEREKKEIETTFELAEIVKSAVTMKVRNKKGHPAKQTFQAIRIEVNGELDALSESIDTMIELLNPRGRIAAITFHSLEDRIVKNAFKRNEDPCICPKDFPVCVCGRKSKGRVITRKPIAPGGEELSENNRAKSAKLRVFERA